MKEEGRADQIEPARERSIPGIMLKKPDLQPGFAAPLNGEFHREGMKVARFYLKVDSFPVRPVFQGERYIPSTTGHIQDAKGSPLTGGKRANHLPNPPCREREEVDPGQSLESSPMGALVQLE